MHYHSVLDVSNYHKVWKGTASEITLVVLGNNENIVPNKQLKPKYPFMISSEHKHCGDFDAHYKIPTVFSNYWWNEMELMSLYVETGNGDFEALLRLKINL